MQAFLESKKVLDMLQNEMAKKGVKKVEKDMENVEINRVYNEFLNKFENSLLEKKGNQESFAYVKTKRKEIRRQVFILIGEKFLAEYYFFKQFSTSSTSSTSSSSNDSQSLTSTSSTSHCDSDNSDILDEKFADQYIEDTWEGGRYSSAVEKYQSKFESKRKVLSPDYKKTPFDEMFSKRVIDIVGQDKFQIIKNLVHHFRQIKKSTRYYTLIFGGFVRGIIKNIASELMKIPVEELEFNGLQTPPEILDITSETIKDIDIEVHSITMFKKVVKNIEEFASSHGYTLTEDSPIGYKFFDSILGTVAAGELFIELSQDPKLAHIKEGLILQGLIMLGWKYDKFLERGGGKFLERGKEFLERGGEQWTNEFLVDQIKKSGFTFENNTVSKPIFDYNNFVTALTKFVITDPSTGATLSIDVVKIKEVEYPISYLGCEYKVFDADINTLYMLPLSDCIVETYFGIKYKEFYHLYNRSSGDFHYNIIMNILKGLFFVPGIEIEERIEKIESKGYVRTFDNPKNTRVSKEWQLFIDEIMKRLAILFI